MKFFLFAQQIVHKTQVAAGDGDAAGDIDCFVGGELGSLDEVECDCVFEAAVDVVS